MGDSVLNQGVKVCNRNERCSTDLGTSKRPVVDQFVDSPMREAGEPCCFSRFDSDAVIRIKGDVRHDRFLSERWSLPPGSNPQVAYVACPLPYCVTVAQCDRLTVPS